MKKLLLVACIISFSSVCNLVAGQKLYVDPSQSSLFPSVIDSGSVVNLKFHVVADTYTAGEYINMNYRVVNSLYDSSAIFIGEYALLTTGDSAIIAEPSFRIESYGGFSSGDDIIVIWPTGSGGIAYTSDSIIDTIHVQKLTAGVPELAKTPLPNIILYPNSSETILYLKYNETAINLEQVRIYDLLGHVLLTETSSLNAIPINTLPNGFYFMEAMTTDNNRYVSQFVKTR
jgi:hypothetical protein